MSTIWNQILSNCHTLYEDAQEVLNFSQRNKTDAEKKVAVAALRILGAGMMVVSTLTGIGSLPLIGCNSLPLLASSLVVFVIARDILQLTQNYTDYKQQKKTTLKITFSFFNFFSTSHEQSKKSALSVKKLSEKDKLFLTKGTWLPSPIWTYLVYTEF